jgi:transcriptional regulator with XRE-family HTH domain
MTPFAALLCRTMTERGMTIEQLAAMLGVNVSTVSRWRRDRMPLIEHADRLADALARPHLLTLVIRARSRDCEECGAAYVTNSRIHTRRRFCGPACQERSWYHRKLQPEAKLGVICPQPPERVPGRRGRALRVVPARRWTVRGRRVRAAPRLAAAPARRVMWTSPPSSISLPSRTAPSWARRWS